MTGKPTDSNQSLVAIEELLHRRIGLDVTTVGSSLVQRAVQRRMAVRGLTTMTEYALALPSDRHEIEELVEEVVIPETYFFREPEALDAIALRATQGEWRATGSNPLRVLSAPCSTGEEPYSVAMTLLAAGVSPDGINVDAIDVSREAVRRARSAIYKPSSFRGASRDWLRFFDEGKDEIRLHTSVRRLVRVVQGNLLDPAFSPPRLAYDVIFCRNLLIYFDAETQARVLATLATCLDSTGVLVVGAADTFAVRRAGFTPVQGSERSFLFERLPVNQVPVENTSARKKRRDAPATRKRAPAARSMPEKVPVRTVAPPAKATRVIQLRPPLSIEAPHASTGRPLLDEIARLADSGLLTDALRQAERAIAAGEATADLHAIVGTLHAALGSSARAEASYRRALYLDPAHPDALIHLALLLEQRGEMTSAARLHARAERGRTSDKGSIA